MQPSENEVNLNKPTITLRRINDAKYIQKDVKGQQRNTANQLNPQLDETLHLEFK